MQATDTRTARPTAVFTIEYAGPREFSVWERTPDGSPIQHHGYFTTRRAAFRYIDAQGPRSASEVVR